MSRLISDEAWATLTLWQECRGEPHNGRVAVAEVILNRMHRHYQSDGTVAGTCLRAFQFSGWNARDPHRVQSAMLDDEDLTVLACRNAWREAQTGTQWARGAVHYLNPETLLEMPPWVGACHEVAHIGAHIFYALGAI